MAQVALHERRLSREVESSGRLWRHPDDGIHRLHDLRRVAFLESRVENGSSHDLSSSEYQVLGCTASCANTSLAHAAVTRYQKLANECSGLKQEEIGPPASETGFGHQDIERDARHVIRERVHVRVLFHVQDLEITMAGIATLGLDRGAAALNAIIRNTLGRIAEHALDTHRVPLQVAKRASQIAQAGVRGAGAHHTHHGRGTTRRAEMRGLEPAEGTGPERRDEMQPVRLQRRADEWYRRP